MLSFYNHITNTLNRSADTVLPTLARFVFAATLLFYFWNSGLTKFELNPFSPSMNGYVQIFPKAMEAVGYDITQLSWFNWAVVVTGTFAEFILPFLIMIGLFTRLAALGMIGFVVVQSLTDLYGHDGISEPATLGAWFDGLPTGVILDQRAFWMVVLVTLSLKGAGAFSVDYLLINRR